MVCVREREETAVDSAWVTAFGEGFGEATRGSKKEKNFYIKVKYQPKFYASL
jgi:hypothetical protein